VYFSSGAFARLSRRVIRLFALVARSDTWRDAGNTQATLLYIAGSAVASGR